MRCYKSGYAELIDRRVPTYARMINDNQKLWLLKECLVEDYRISLNLDSQSGMFILPGKYTFSSDLRAPELLAKGVEIMRSMLKPAIEDLLMRRKTGSSESEVTDFALMQSILETSMDPSWEPGTQQMSQEEHLAVAERLFHNSNSAQIAVTTAR